MSSEVYAGEPESPDSFDDYYFEEAILTPEDVSFAENESGSETHEPACTRATACGNSATCNLCSGTCEPRAAGWSPFSLLSVYPLHGAVGDYIVIDGAGFGALTAVSLGGISLSKSVDENRIIAIRADGASGTLKVGGASYGLQLVTSQAYETLQPCTYNDIAATQKIPSDPAEIGPYGIGFADRTGGIFGPKIRVYYPAQCSGLRKPPADGKFPFIMFVHGDGYVPLNFEYLARHLASYGFMSAIPENPNYSILKTGRTSPEDWFAPLKGHETGGDAVIICHSKGAEYTYNLGYANIKAVVFLGPVYTMENSYISYFPIQGLVMGGSQDGSPSADRCLDVYEQLEKPKYMVMIKRGTHGQFLDDKMWEPPTDGSGPYIARNRQHELVQSFVLAYLERVFKLEEHFSTWIDEPKPSDEFVFSSKL